MNIYTSYFAKYTNEKPDLVPISIARSAPVGYIGCVYRKLAPTAEILASWKANHNEAAYIAAYQRDVLDKLDPQKVLEELRQLSSGKDIVLLCWESSEKFCHRHLAVEWLAKYGVPVVEWNRKSRQEEPMENFSLF